MIKTKTLFILGAGASAPFGYPTSIKLREDILNRGKDDSIINALNRFNDSLKPFEKNLENFLDQFSRSGVYSIDSFLEHRTEFMEIGKISIAAYLINHEEDTLLRQAEDNWYMYLYDRLKASFENLNQNNISFITFNYDRSLEQFFFEAIRSRFGKDPTECAEKMKNIPIVHLYGQLDLLPWQGRDGKKYSHEYDYNLIERLRAAPGNIKLISDERDVAKSEEFKKAYNLVNNAERIYFLGFSFDEINLERLGISLMKDKSIRASAIGLEPAKLRWIKRHFVDKINTQIYLNERADALSLLQDDLEIE